MSTKAVRSKEIKLVNVKMFIVTYSTNAYKSTDLKYHNSTSGWYRHKYTVQSFIWFNDKNS